MTTPATLDGVAAALDTLLNRLAPGSQVPVPAYDRPALTAAEVKFTDGFTFNSDGSLWTVSDGTAPSPGGASALAGTPVPRMFGYFSPVKTPEIWEAAQKFLSPEFFARWHAAWKANPYAIYTLDPRPMIAAGTVNAITFSYLTQPSTSFVQ